MASFLPRVPALILLFLLSTSSPSLSITPLAFKCSTPRPPAMDPHAARALLGALAEDAASHAGFAASSAGGDRLHGLAQCRPDLSPAGCAACLRAGAGAVVSLCMGSAAGSAWFDGCYLHYYYGSRAAELFREARPLEARSNGSYAPDRTRFRRATAGLFSRLVAEAGLPSHKGFSYGEAGFGDRGGRVYATVECLQSISPEGCETCLAEAVTLARVYCSKMEGGLAVAGDCAVRFESHRFLSNVPPAAAAAATADTTSYDENGEGDGLMGVKGKVFLVVVWLAGLACFVGVAMGLWLLRRRILSVRVAAATIPLDGVDEEVEKDSKK